MSSRRKSPEASRTSTATSIYTWMTAVLRLVVGGELIEYTEMMGRARNESMQRMTKSAEELGADAIIDVRFTTSVIVSNTAEFLVYGTAVKLQ